MTLKQRVFSLLSNADGRDRSQRRIESAIGVLILLNIVAIILESFEGVGTRYAAWFFSFEAMSVTVFSVEYLARLWVADLEHAELTPWRARLRFVTSTLGLIDLLAILPFFLPLFFTLDLRVLRALRLFRLLRILKLNRYSNALRLVGQVFHERRADLLLTVFVTFVLMLFSSTLMYFIEHDEQPEAFPNILGSFWWAVATLTTVGYGDVYPITPLGKMVGGVIALLGIGLVALPTGILSSAFVERIAEAPPEGVLMSDEHQAERLDQNRGERPPTRPAYRYCPHCGEKLEG
ncbi:MAG: potassium channel family protein [Catalinimonas sp.]